jgi:hypothetical protein
VSPGPCRWPVLRDEAGTWHIDKDNHHDRLASVPDFPLFDSQTEHAIPAHSVKPIYPKAGTFIFV